jgi:hypothetical protein
LPKRLPNGVNLGDLVREDMPAIPAIDDRADPEINSIFDDREV